MFEAVEEALAAQLRKKEEQGALRTLQDHQGLVDFSSNDYLGYGRDFSIWKWEPAPSRFWGTRGSRLVTGHHEFIEELERKIAQFHRAQAALIFNSGYDANVGFFSSVVGKSDLLILDEQVHASIRDGAKLSGCQRLTFRHNDIHHLEKRLKGAQGLGLKRKVFVAVESVYSMDGDLAPLKEMAALCETYQGLLVVDEAHATGVMGARGEGLVPHLGLEEKVFARIHTFGKALGVHGAAILGSPRLRQFLINFARSFIYTTALPAHSYWAIDRAYQRLSYDDQRRANLKNHIEYFQRKIGACPGPSPIIPILIPDKGKLKALSFSLKKAGFNVLPILSPTVQRGKERLRICLHAFNTREEMDLLADHLREKL